MGELSYSASPDSLGRRMKRKQAKGNEWKLAFLARDSICYSALYAIARPSVRLSVRLSVTRVDQSKTVEVRIMQLSPQSSFLTLNFNAKFQRQHRVRGRRIAEGFAEKIRHFQQITVQDRTKVTIND